MRSAGCPEILVNNKQHMLHNNPQQWGPHPRQKPEILHPNTDSPHFKKPDCEKVKHLKLYVKVIYVFVKDLLSEMFCWGENTNREINAKLLSKIYVLRFKSPLHSLTINQQKYRYVSFYARVTSQKSHANWTQNSHLKQCILGVRGLWASSYTVYDHTTSG
jgi:hypothetical protein